MSQEKRRGRNNDDLIEAAQEQRANILKLYRLFEDKRPVMVFGLQDQKIAAYPYEQFKADLSPRSQAMSTAEYEEAVAEDQIVVFVRDDETRRLVSLSIGEG